MTGFSRTSDRMLTSSSASSSPKAQNRKNTPTSKVHGPPDHGFVAGRCLTKVLGLKQVTRSASKPAVCSDLIHAALQKNALRRVFNRQRRHRLFRVPEDTSKSKVHGSSRHGDGKKYVLSKWSATGNSSASDNSVIQQSMVNCYFISWLETFTSIAMKLQTSTGRCWVISRSVVKHSKKMVDGNQFNRCHSTLRIDYRKLICKQLEHLGILMEVRFLSLQTLPSVNSEKNSIIFACKWNCYSAGSVLTWEHLDVACSDNQLDKSEMTKTQLQVTTWHHKCDKSVTRRSLRLTRKRWRHCRAKRNNHRPLTRCENQLRIIGLETSDFFIRQWQILCLRLWIILAEVSRPYLFDGCVFSNFCQH